MSPKNNMYDWVTGTWNPIGGECPHACSYCYVKSNNRPAVKKKYTGKPYLVEHELKKSLGKGKFIFVCSMMDLFAEGFPDKWIFEIIEHANQYDNQYLFQTKNPGRAESFSYAIPQSFIIGTTIETNRQKYDQMGNASIPLNRAISLMRLSNTFKTMVTVEPIMDFDMNGLFPMIKMCNPSWVNIGADSKGHNLPEPSPDKIRALISELRNNSIEVKLKSNLKRLIG